MQDDGSKNEHEEYPAPDDKPKVEGFGVSDVVTVLVIALLAGGFWWWYSSAKSESTQRFQAASDLWAGHDYKAAKKAYEDLQENARFVSQENDTMMTHRLARIDEWEEQAANLEEGVKAAILSKDTALLTQARQRVATDSNRFVEKARLLAILDSATHKEK